MLAQILRIFSSVFLVLYTMITIGLSYIPEKQDQLETPSFSVNGPAPEDETVYILQSREEISFDLQQAFDLYSSNLPEKPQFSIQTVGGEADYRSALRAKLLSGEKADLFHISGARELIELEEYVIELNFLPWVSTAISGSLDAVTREGRIFGVPYSIEATGFICNQDVFEEAGISLTEIQSFEALNEAFVTLNDKINAGELGENFASLEAVCEFPAQDKSFLGGEFSDIALSGAFDSPASAAISPSVNFPASDAVEELLKLMAKFSSNRNDWPEFVGVTKSDQIERFANGKIAVMLADTNVYRLVNELTPGLSGRMFLLPVPLDTFEQPSVYAGVPIYWAINSTSSEKSRDFTVNFLTWLYCSPDGAEYFADRFREVSPFQKTAKSTGVTLHNHMLNYLGAGMSLPQLHKEFPHNWGRDIFAENVQSYFTQREKTWEDIVKSSEEGWNGTVS